MSNPVLLEMRDVRKSFGATKALKGVSLELHSGTALALIGENGAGKSTLMKVLSGAKRPDSGEIFLEGKCFQPAGPRQAREAGVEMIHQELTLAPDLTIEQNLVLGSEPARAGWVDRRKRREAAIRALNELGHADIPLHVPAGMLPVSRQQVVEIARALLRNPKVLVLDEPTSSLGAQDVQKLFEAMTRLKSRGVSLVYISHFLEECRIVAERYTVLRDGVSVGSGGMETVSEDEIIRMMAGRELDATLQKSMGRPQGDVVLSCEKLAGRSRPVDARLELREGEVLGVFGLVGAGRTETLRLLYGLDRPLGGGVYVAGKSAMPRSPRRSVREGMGFVSENRKEEGLLLNRSIAENLTMTAPAVFSRIGWMSLRGRREHTGSWMKELGVRARSPDQPVGELSGGNQQKVAIARLLHQQARILLLDEPTRGIDVNSKADIYRLIRELAGQGRAVLLSSSYMPELFTVCDRIAPMTRGVIGKARPVGEWSEQSLLKEAIS